MTELVKYSLYITALALFMLSAFVNDWLDDMQKVISGVNIDFWVKLPFVFQVFLIGVICAI
jgi:hypothetical protein